MQKLLLLHVQKLLLLHVQKLLLLHVQKPLLLHVQKLLLLRVHRDCGGRYFASDGFSFGSSTGNWQRMRAAMHAAGKVFIPSVGPVQLPSPTLLMFARAHFIVTRARAQGYDDTKIRPWNSEWKRERDAGSYYDRM